MTLKEIQKKLSENRQKLNSELSDVDRKSVLKEQNELEISYRAALDAKETREVPEELHKTASIASYMKRASTGGNLNGVERELNQELKLEDSHLPFSMLLPTNSKLETRADAATNIGSTAGPTTQQNIIQQIFARSDAAFLGVQFPSVPVGQQSYPVLTAGHTGAILAEGTAVEATAATITSKNITPKRLSARYVISKEDISLVRGLEDSLRSDMRNALNKLLDSQICRGNGTNPNFSGIVSTVTFGSTPSNKVTFKDFVAGVLRPLDGVTLYEPMEIGLTMTSLFYKWLSSEFVVANNPKTWVDWIKETGIQLRITEKTTAANANKAEILTVEKTEKTKAYAPIWQNLELIADPYSNSAKGQVNLTLVMLAGFEVIRSGYRGEIFKLV